MHVVTLGDVMLDVIVEVPAGLRPDDDSEATITLAAGGQAANVASWVAKLGASATLVGPRGRSSASTLITERLLAHGIEFAGIDVDDAGTVVSIVAPGTRTLASDPGDLSWLNRVDEARVAGEVDWLHVSGYPLLRAADPTAILRTVEGFQMAGAKISVDLSSTSLIESYGVARFARLLEAMRPDLVFGNATEWDALGLDPASAAFDVVRKDGPAGATVVRRGVATEHPAHTVEVVDVTGGGDALAAGYLVGGPELAMRTAARCVAQRGAQPPA